MIRYDDALKIIQGLRLELGPERVALERAGGRTLAEDLTAQVPSPPYTNSAMDGFAMRREDAVKAPLQILGTIYARALKDSEIPAYRPGGCVRIMTGAWLPDWCDTVIPVENSELLNDGAVRFTEVPEPGVNIRFKGEDLDQDALVLKAGTVLEPERVMVAAAFGYKDVLVTERPRLVFLATGDELVEPGEPLPPGAIYNSSKYFLLAAARSLGFDDAVHLTIPDDEDAAAELVRDVAMSGKPTVLVSTGAVSAGDLDFIPKVGARLGFEARFHKVAIRPGKPVYVAQHANCVWLGLPGNPISTCVGWHIFARPLLSAVAGLPPAERTTVVLQNEVRKPEHLRCFFRAEVNGNKAWVAKRQGSAQLAASICNDAYVELPEGFARIPADTRVAAILV